MGPQHRCCGNANSAEGRNTGKTSFNGAAASMLRKLAIRNPAILGRPVASMGPQHRCCGNSASLTFPRFSVLLQWGRSIDAAEMSDWQLVREFFKRLQWGRSIDAAEIWCQQSKRSLVLLLQWGRSIDAAEMNVLAAVVLGTTPASMGPQHRCCGNTLTVTTAIRPFNASMGPQHRCCGNPDRLSDIGAPVHASMGPQHRCCGNCMAWTHS